MRFFSLKLFSDLPHINFVRLTKYALFVSALFSLISAVTICFKGFNLGIDFIGGAKIEVYSSIPIETSELRNSLASLNVGEVSVQSLSSKGRFAIKVANRSQNVCQLLKDTLTKSFPKLHYLSSCFVGPQINKYFIRSALQAVLLGLLGIVGYVLLRFGLAFGFGIMFTLVHNLLLSLGFMSAFRLDFNQSTIAALLIIMGYCVNDSIVVYDRIMSNLGSSSISSDAVNASINQTLSRNVLTSLTTLLANLALILFGCKTIMSFSLLVFVGIAIGTYSSIFLAAPAVLYFTRGAK
jgi:preprotein translocase subunit SecF